MCARIPAIFLFANCRGISQRDKNTLMEDINTNFLSDHVPINYKMLLINDANHH